MKKISTRNWFRIVWFSLVAIFFVWQWSAYQSKGVDKDLLANDPSIGVSVNKQKISFIPGEQPEIDVLFFPGGLVDPKAYVPLARRIAENGFSVHIIKMPWRLSTLGYNRIKKLFDLKNQSKRFVLGGHSQGGKMAARFVYENPRLISGLYLLGTSHPRDIDLSDRSLPTIKIFAESDGLASMKEIEENAGKLPRGTTHQLIEGGNHSQFGFMGNLLMDGTAHISREEQLAQTVKYLTEFLRKIKQRGSRRPENGYLLKVCEGPSDEPGVRCGYINQAGDTIIPLGKYQYCYTDTLRHVAFVLNREGTCLAVDTSGKELYEVYWFDNGPDYISEGLFRIKKGGKIGYADEQGKIAISPQFECADPFEEGRARVATDCEQVPEGEHIRVVSNAWFYIDKQGNRVEE